MKPKIYVARPVSEEVEQYIAQHFEYRKWASDQAIPRETLLAELANVSGLLISGGSIDDALLDAAPHLKVVSNMSAGYNNFDLTAMKKRGVLGTNTPTVLRETVADLVFALILATARRIAELDAMVKAGQWKQGNDASLFGLDVHHRKLGIIGMGGIGEAIATRAMHGFHMDVVYHNRTRKTDIEQNLGVTYRSLDQLLQESDFVVLMVPLSEQTYHYIGKKQFALMKKTAIFINASRGQTVDEQALIEVLDQGGIYGAGLDVFEQEPVDPNNPLLSMPNVVTLPHIGSATAKTRSDMAMLAAQNLLQGLSGQVPDNLVPELRLG